MKLNETMILYTPSCCTDRNTAGKMRLVPWPLKLDDRAFLCTSGACYTQIHDMTPSQKTRFLFILAMQLIIRNGIDPMTVHNTLCEIREYRDGLAADVPVPDHLKLKFQREVMGD